MADTKITALTALAQVDPANDVFVAVDVSDTAMAASGTDKKVTPSFMRYAGYSDINGAGYTYTNATTVTIGAGLLGINGKLVNLAGGAYNLTGTGATQAKNVAGANITSWATNSAYFIFAKDDGTIAFEILDGTGDGAAPVYDVNYGYYKAAATGLSCRRIGKFFTDAVDVIMSFKQSGTGRDRRYWIHDQAAKILVSGVVQNVNWTAVPGVASYLSADEDETRWLLTATAASTSSIVGVLLSLDGGTAGIFQSTTNMAVNLTTGAQFGVDAQWLPYTGTAHYKTAGDGPGYVGIAGIKFQV